MTQDYDDVLGRLLRADAPAERDPMFRIRLLERRARQRYQRRSRLLLGVAAALMVVPAAVLALATDRLAAALVVGFSVALAAATLVSARGVLQVVRHLRKS